MTHLTVVGPSLGVWTCGRRLNALGVTGPPPDAWSPQQATLELALEIDDGAGPAELGARITWNGPASLAERDASEVTVQARCGLMHVHGRESGRPRRLGLEVASVASGLLAAQGILATLISRRRHGPPGSLGPMETSVLQAGLAFMTTYVSRLSCAGGWNWAEWPTAAAAPAPGPPFPTADGRWVELEALSPEPWASFWTSLGIPHPAVAQGWNQFSSRYSAAACALPDGFHQATARRPLVELADLARACRLVLVPLRNYREVLAATELPGAAHPLLDEVVSPTGPEPEPARGGSARCASHQGLPLEGLSVVEATSRIQGPLAGQLLRMLGAQVTRVEPAGGDGARLVPPLAGDTGAFFLSTNRGKSTVELDLATPSGRSALVELVADADVFLHNWRPGKAEAWGLDAGSLAAANPCLVYCEASGWGQETGSGLSIGTEFLVQAHAGLGEGLNPAGEAPFPSRVLLADVMGAMVACEGALAGLWRRELTGRGCVVRTSLLAGALTLEAHVLDALAGGHERQRREGRPQWGPLDRPVAAADGYLAVSAEGQTAVTRIAALCGVGPDKRRDASMHAVIDCLAKESVAHWESALGNEGIACAAVATDLSALPTIPGLAGLFEPLGSTGWAPASPWRFPL